MAKHTVILVLASSILSANSAWAAEKLQMDVPRHIGDIEAACTGVGLDSRQDPRWQSYPLKVEIAGQGGQYLGDVVLTVSRDGKEVISVQCDGPWLLFRIAPGRYQIRAETDGKTVQSMASIPFAGQGRIILRFPDLGGQSATRPVSAP